MLTPKLKEFISDPHGMGIGTIDASLKPEYQRALGAVAIDDDHIKIFVDELSAGRTFDNLRENARLAVVMVSLNNAESYQFKGRCTGWEQTTEAELAIFDEYMKQFDLMATAVGFPAGGVYNYPHTSMVSLVMQVETIYEQTPRKGTGQKVSA